MAFQENSPFWLAKALPFFPNKWIYSFSILLRFSLLDVDQCIESGYTILKEPENEDSNYTVAYSLDDAGTQTIVQIGRAAGPVGMCETCTGSGDLMKGLRAEVRGVVTSIGSDDEPPTITVTTATVSNGRSDFCGPTTSINTTTDPNVTTPTKNPQTNSGASDYVTGCITNVVGMLLFSGLTAFVL